MVVRIPPKRWVMIVGNDRGGRRPSAGTRRRSGGGRAHARAAQDSSTLARDASRYRAGHPRDYLPRSYPVDAAGNARSCTTRGARPGARLTATRPALSKAERPRAAACLLTPKPFMLDSDSTISPAGRRPAWNWIMIATCSALPGSAAAQATHSYGIGPLMNRRHESVLLGPDGLVRGVLAIDGGVHRRASGSMSHSIRRTLEVDRH
jgi:hypothetical protein